MFLKGSIASEAFPEQQYFDPNLQELWPQGHGNA